MDASDIASVSTVMGYKGKQVLAAIALTLIIAVASLLAKSTTMFVVVIAGVVAARIAIVRFFPELELTDAEIAAQDRACIAMQAITAARYRARFGANGYDFEGYDMNGYDGDGYDRSGYDWFGYDRCGRDVAGWDEYGYGVDGEPL
jgi:hypothetical protein